MRPRLFQEPTEQLEAELIRIVVDNNLYDRQVEDSLRAIRAAVMAEVEKHKRQR